MNMLAMREYSAYELSSKMKLKGYQQEAIEYEIESLQNDGLQCDTRFAESMCRHYSSKGKGRLYVQQYLFTKGVSKVIVSETINTFCWGQAIAIARRKLSNIQGPVLVKRLYARGFTLDEANEVASNKQDE